MHRFCLALLLLSCIACPVCSRNKDLGQSDYYGPYIGQVIDVDTGKGIPGVLVVASWDRTYENLFQPEYKLIHVIETHTDEEGNYRIPEYPPPWKRRICSVNEPGFIYFKSGYGSARGYEIIHHPGIENTKVWQDWRYEDAQNLWNRCQGKVETIKLKWLPTVQDRRELLHYSDCIFCEPMCKTLMKLYREEAVSLAAESCPPERRE